MKSTTIIIRLYIVVSMLLTVLASCDGTESLFLGGAELKMVETSPVKRLKPVMEACLSKDAQQIFCGSDGTVYVSYRQSDTLLSSLREGREVPAVIANDSLFHVGAVHTRCQNDICLIDFRSDFQTVTTIRPDGVIVGDIELADYFPWSLGETRSIHVLHEGIFAEQRFQDHRHVRIAGKDGNIIRDWAVYDISLYDMEKSICDFTCYVKPDGTRAALLMEHLDRVNILDLINGNGFSVTTTEGSSSDKKSFRNAVKTKKDKFHLDCYYRNGVATDNRIYALYVPAKDIFHATGENAKVYLHIFDWNGSFIANYQLSDGTFSIAVDENNGQLYGLNYNNLLSTYHLN